MIKALALRRKLAAANPAAYEPDVATTLNNLGILYADTQRHIEAEEAYAEALALRRKYLSWRRNLLTSQLIEPNSSL